MPEIAENLKALNQRIAAAAGRSGRRPDEITLVAVTKTVGASQIRKALAAGVTDIGENYVQEAIDKYLQIGAGPRWHMIGHLQRNKAKHAVGVFDLVQAVDSLELAEELGKRALTVGKTMDILIEINVSGEESKFGIKPAQALSLASRIAQVEGVRVQGLMSMAPFMDNAEETRPYCAALKALWDRLPDEQRRFLSMGMTQDFEVAIEEGANMVRVGTAIFGPRRA